MWEDCGRERRRNDGANGGKWQRTREQQFDIWYLAVGTGKIENNF